MFDENHPFYGSYRIAKRVAIAIVGGSIVVAGIVLAVMPVLPGWPAIFLGLGILGLEFAWARLWLKKAREKAAAAARMLTGRGNDKNRPPPTA